MLLNIIQHFYNQLRLDNIAQYNIVKLSCRVIKSIHGKKLLTCSRLIKTGLQNAVLPNRPRLDNIAQYNTFVLLITLIKVSCLKIYTEKIIDLFKADENRIEHSAAHSHSKGNEQWGHSIEIWVSTHVALRISLPLW